MNKALEKHKSFPYIAWATILGFAFFTYTLAAGLKDDLQYLDQNVAGVESSLNELKDMRTNESAVAE